MVFSSISFLFYFLPITVALYFIVPQRAKNLVLAVSSLVFYTWGGGAFVFILLVSIFVDYFFGQLAQRGHDDDDRARKRLAVGGSLAVNLGLLAYFKYANFFVAQLNTLGDRFGLGEIAWQSVALPIGISFFTFQSMSYTIDVARGAARHLRNPLDFALYVALFPQLVAGPIVRFHEIAHEMRGRESTRDDTADGVLRFAHGLVKKVVIADSVGRIADAVFATPTESLTTSTVWLGVAAYTLQIYFDFSGYSDMAIGLGRVFGFHFPENFNRPYSAVSVTDFWRRWHITLSNWFRDYVYIPLGGSRVEAGRMYANLIFVFFVTGLWHGANWTFVVWGLYHGALLIVERVTDQRALVANPTREPLRRFITLTAVVFGWVLFRANTLGDAWAMWSLMLRPVGGAIPSAVLEAATTKNLMMLVIGAIVVLLPRSYNGWRTVVGERGWPPVAARAVLTFGLLPYALLLVTSGTFSPFLYFQF